MKAKLTFALAALACGAAFAQAPAGVVERPSAQHAPLQAGGKPQEVAEARKDARAMDLNNDGMITRKEWDAYHAGVWAGMRVDKNGSVAWTDVQAHMGMPRGGPVGKGGMVGAGGSATAN